MGIEPWWIKRTYCTAVLLIICLDNNKRRTNMKWNKFRLKTTTEAEDIVSSMLMDLVYRESRLRIRFR